MADQSGIPPAPTAPPSPDADTFPMVFGDGSRAMVPSARVNDAYKAGGKLAQPMKMRDGSMSLVPFDQVHDQMSRGATFMPSSAAGTVPKPQPPQMREVDPTVGTGAGGALLRAGQGILGAPKQTAQAFTQPPQNDEEAAVAAAAPQFGTGKLALAAKRLLFDPQRETYQQGQAMEDLANQNPAGPRHEAALRDTAGALKMASLVPLVGPLAAHLAMTYQGDPSSSTASERNPYGTEGDPSGALTEGLAYAAEPGLTEKLGGLQGTGQAAFTDLMNEPLPIEGTGPAGRVKVGDVGKALQQYSQEEVGAPLKATPETREQAIKRYVKAAEPEVKYQLAQDKTGLDWYKNDITKMQQIFAENGYPELHPETGDPAKQTIFRALVAGASLGNKEVPTVRNAQMMWDDYKRTGEAPVVNPRTGRGFQNGQFNAYQSGFEKLNKLLADKGEQGAADWLMTQHPVSELRQYGNVAGKASDMRYGGALLGPKMGPFFLNMSGIHSELTADLWHARKWNRIMGTLEDPASESGLIDAPRNEGERAIMKEAEARLAQKLGLDTASSQAVGWNYEQSLYNVHGIERQLASYADAAQQHFGGTTPIEGANAGEGARAAAAGQTPVPGGIPQSVGGGVSGVSPENPAPAGRGSTAPGKVTPFPPQPKAPAPMPDWVKGPQQIPVADWVRQHGFEVRKAAGRGFEVGIPSSNLETGTQGLQWRRFENMREAKGILGYGPDVRQPSAEQVLPFKESPVPPIFKRLPRK